ncbi:hypothetical protein PINS_up003568 [Pythium insidiosum]|nr:hypothetical protein PINS_up003568 [Pythium insidiosum]
MLAEQDTRSIGFIGDDATRQIKDVVQRSKTNYTNPKGTITVDAAFLDAYARPQTFSGGLVMAAKAEYELVLLTRIRDCTNTGCQTLFLGDYRYESGRFLSDFVDWNALVSVFRVIAQVYMILRLICLVIAVYMAYPAGERSILRSARLLLCEVPSHVIAYGSALPVVLYALAHCIDASMTQMTLFARLLKIQGSVEKDEWEVIQIICLLMRCQWIMAIISWLWVLVQTSLQGWRRQNGVVSVRGHVFGIIASMSVILGYRNPRYRDNNILELADENPAPAVMLAGITLRELSIQRLGGVFSDILSILLCGAIYGAVMFILRYAQFYAIRFGLFKLLKLPEPIDDKKQHAHLKERTGIYFSETKRLPSTCGVLWSPAALSCAWGGDLALSFPGLEEHDATAQRFMLMNIVFMSEPLAYLYIRYGFHSTLIASYKDPDSGRLFALAENPEIDDHTLLDETAPWKNAQSMDSSFAARKYELLQKKPVYSVPFHELVRCR